MLHQRLLKNKVGKKFKKGQIWVRIIKIGTKGKKRQAASKHKSKERLTSSSRGVEELPATIS
jgi:hypothetical protein